MVVISSFQLMDLFNLAVPMNLIFVTLFTIILLPIIIFLYLVTTWSRKCLINFVKWKYPNCIVVEKNSVRSILDQGRNHGIYTLLVQGRSIGEGTRSHLLHLTSNKKYLRLTLTTRWGLYVWKDNEQFVLDNHLFNSSCSFRGRPITESNIQDYVSDLTSKFLPTGRSPWQVHVINCSLGEKECQICLVRVHHLLLHLEHLSPADFLPLKCSSDNWACQETNSPFTDLYVEPSALPKLHQKLTENFSNYWNEFLCNNDPIERPEIMKKQIGFFQCVKIVMIVFVATSKELTRQYRKSEGLRFSDIFPILQRELNRRNFGMFVIFFGILRTFSPINIFKAIVSWSWYLLITLTFKLPILMIRELQALQSKQKHFYPDTLTSMIWCYFPLIIQTIVEVFSITWIAIGAPKLILEELFLKHHQANQLQTISPCGRKVVAWSEEVSLDLLRKISSVTGATDVEILLTAIVDSMKEYFKHCSVRIPDDVLTTAKFVNQRAIFFHNHETRGIVCLALPTKTPLFEDDLLEILQVIQRNVQEARAKQSAIYAITAAEASRGLISSTFPSILLKLILNQLSRRYTLSLTHIDGNIPVEGVDAAVYWRPPQGNCNMSITLHRYGNGVRLGVMGDALIAPEHSVITRRFPKSLQNLSTIVGVPKTPILEDHSRSPSPHSTSPTTSPGY